MTAARRGVCLFLFIEQIYNRELAAGSLLSLLDRQIQGAIMQAYSKGGSLKVWIVNVNEPLPTDPGHNRLWRMGHVFDLLRKRGHDVTWWSSTMHHFDKRLRYEETTEIALDDRARIIHLHGRFYGRNISLDRFWNHRQLGKAFRAMAPGKPQPDVIIASIPILDLPREAVRYADPRNIPVVIDVRDKWPDFMMDQVPAVAKPLARVILNPLFEDAKVACQKARAIWGVAPSFVQWGLDRAGRPGTEADHFFPHAYPQTNLDDSLLEEAGRFWDEKGVPVDRSLPTLLFIGSFNFTAFDFETVVQGMKKLRGKAQLVFCGSGVGEEKLRGLAADVPNIIFPGWVDEPALRVIMQRAHLGLTPYRNTSNFTENLPNKFLEYMSQGLPVVSCLTGFSRQVLEDGHAGYFYGEGDGNGFARLVTDILDHDARRQQVGRAAKALFEKRFQVEKVYGQLVDELEHLAAKS